MRKDRMKTKEYSAGSTVLTVAFVLICLVWIMPIYEVVVNSLKSNNAINLDVFALPNSESFVGFANYVKGMTFGNYPFLKSVGYSLFISVVSTALILLCCSMAAWYIARVRSGFAKFFYYLCLFSMIVPFQMVMFTLTSTADSLKLNTPWTIPVIYLGFGAGLAIFMFVGFVKSLPLEIEEAASIDGCGPVRTYFNVVLPMLKPAVSVQLIFTFVESWNNYFLPALLLDKAEMKTVPIMIAQLRAADYSKFDLGKVYMFILLAILPVLLVYIFLSHYIVKGVTAGSVKG